MKPIYVLGLLLALCAGMFAYALAGPSRQADPGGRAQAAGPRQASPELVAELEALRASQAELLARLDDLEARQVILEGRQAADATRVVAELEGESERTAQALDALAAALSNPEAGAPVPLESLVLDVLQTKEARERAEREARRLEQREERMTQRIEALTVDLGLNEFQAREMRRVLTNEETKRDEFFAGLRDGAFGEPDRDTIRDGMRALRDEVNTSLHGVLSPAQLQRYGELQEDRSRGWGGGDDRRGRGRGDDGDRRRSD